MNFKTIMKEKNKICLIYNFAQHYRLGVFKRIDQELNSDFYFGDKLGDIKKIDYKELRGYKGELKNIRLISNFYWQKGAIKVFFKNYDKFIILGEYYCISTWLILLLSKFTSKKILLWTHGWYGKESSFISFVKKFFFSLADGILLYGNYSKDLMIKEGFKEEKLYVIYNSLNYENQLEIRKELKPSNIYTDYFGNDLPVLIFIGRLTKVKQLQLLIEAKWRLDKSGTPTNLVIIGDGEERENLEAYVEQIELNNSVKFVGQLYNETLIAEYLFNADLCVSPGNVGLTAMHSLMFGTPVITHDNFPYQMPEFEAIEKGFTGDFFEYNNVISLVDIIKKWFLIKNNRDEIRNKCFQIIDSKYNPDFQIMEISKALKEI